MTDPVAHDSSLRDTTARGTVILTVANLSFRVIQVVAFIVLARVLTPEEFGLMALILVPLNILAPLASIGMREAVVHSSGVRRDVVRNATSMAFLASVLLYALMAVFAEPITVYLGVPEAESLLQVTAIVLILESLGTVPEALLSKDLAFFRLGAVTITSDLAYLVVSISLGFAGFGVWSLAYALLAKGVLRLFLAWWFSKGWRGFARGRFDRGLSGGLFAYGWRNVGSQMISLLNIRWDNFVVGKYLNTTQLGYYSRAYALADLVRNLNATVSQVLFPSYTKINEDKPRLRRAYLSSLSVVSLFTVAAAVGLALISQDVPALIGSRWDPIVLPLQILSLVGLVRILASTAAPLFLAVGRPGLNLRNQIVQAIVLIPGTYLIVDRGINAVAWMVLFAFFVGFVYTAWQLRIVFPGILVAAAAAMRTSMVAAAAMVGVSVVVRLGLDRVMGPEPSLAQMGIITVVASVTFVGTAVLIDRPTVAMIWSMLRSLMKRGSAAQAAQ